MQFESIINATSDGVAVIDVNGCFRYFNHAHRLLFGYTDDSELLGHLWHVLYPLDEIKRIESEAFPLLKQSGHWQGVLRSKRKDGSFFDQRLSLSQLEDGCILCLSGELTAQQISTSKLGKDLNLQSAEIEQIGRLFALANHELRSPIASILLATEMLTSQVYAGDGLKREQLAEKIRQASMGVGELMDKFLFLGGQFSGILTFSAVAIPLHSFVAGLESAEWNLGSEAAKYIRLEWTDLAEARMIDRSMLRQVFFNLVGNASKFRAQGTTVDVRLWTVDDRLHFQVCNIGPTLPDNALQDVFEPFFRYEHSNCSAPQSSGLGLYLVRECVKAHGGMVNVSSLPDGVSVDGWIAAPPTAVVGSFQFSNVS